MMLNAFDPSNTAMPRLVVPPFLMSPAAWGLQPAQQPVRQ
jgi:hypothetical protein